MAWDIYSFSAEKRVIQSDVAIVLGAAVWDDRPTPVFEERINHAINLYQRGIVEKIIFTGGKAEHDRFAESDVAKAFAIEKGVPQEHIFIETKSYNTGSNLLEAKRIMEDHDMSQVLIISDLLHMKRALWLAENIGIKAYSSPTPTSRYQSFNSKMGFLVREMYFYGTYLLHLNSCQ